MMQEISALLAQYGLAFVFANMFLEQAGAPVPAVPTLMVAGALAVSSGPGVPAVVAVAVIGSLLGDLIWYVAGRIYGFRVLQLLCRISISPDSCVRDTETRFMRWGAPSLVLAKFVPGFATVAPPVAGALKLPPFGSCESILPSSFPPAAVVMYSIILSPPGPRIKSRTVCLPRGSRLSRSSRS